jgi:hypothetical protein
MSLSITFDRAGVESFRAHPLFDEALLQNAGEKARQFASEPSLHRFALDRGHSMLGIYATCLHLQGRLTVSTLKVAAQELGVASPGRVMSFVAMTKKIGVLSENAPGSDRRVRGLSVSQAFLDFLRDRLRIDLAALAMLSPIGDEALRSFPDPGFFPAYMRVAGEGMGKGGFPPSRSGVMEFFADRQMGLQILYDIIAGDAASLDSVPVAVSISALSKRFGVSRPHVLKLLRDADRRGLVRWHAEARSVELSPRLVEKLRTYVAFIFIGTAYTLLRFRERRFTETVDPGMHGAGP